MRVKSCHVPVYIVTFYMCIRDQLSVLKKSLTSGRSESAELLREISKRRCLLESLTAETNVVERELSELKAKHTEGRQLLDKLEVSYRADNYSIN